MTNQTTVPQGNLLRPACILALISLLGFGLSYSLLATGIGIGLFPEQAGGNLIARDGAVVGSQWVAQPFTSPGYFQARPSAAGYDPMAMAGSNLARSNPALRQRIDEQRAVIAAREGVEPGAVPGDLLTQSGAGLDPHISPQAAQIQVARVARERGMSPGEVQALLGAYTEGRQLGVFGEPRVNVLLLNLALDEAHNR